MKKVTGPALLAVGLLVAACGSDNSNADPTEDTITEDTITEDTITEDTIQTVVATTTDEATENTTVDERDDQQGPAGEGMIVVNQLSPSTEEQIAEFQQPGPDGPIYMVNLLEFKEFAEYEDGRETDLTGREAYALYAEGQRDVLPLFGAEIVFEGDVSFLSIGQVEELWDEVAIVRYPSRATLLEMSASPEFMAVSVHRTAGLAGQLNIETVDPGVGP